MAKKAKEQGENFLDFVPLHSPRNTWDEKDGVVTIHMVHRGFYHKIAQHFFHKPRVSHVDLDAQGSYLWQQIDGVRNVGQLAELMHARFGEEAEPLYDRLVTYLKILRNNGFVELHGKDKVEP